MSADPSFERLSGGDGPDHDCPARAGRTAGDVCGGFAVDVEPVEVREARWELLREAKWWLARWERHRDEESREQLLAALLGLAALIGT